MATLSYILLTISAVVLSTCAPLALAIVFFAAALGVAYRHELRNTASLPSVG